MTSEVRVVLPARSLLFITFFLTISLVGCDHVERISLMANRWNAGEHKHCTFLVPYDLVCDGDQPLMHNEAAFRKMSLATSIVIDRGEYDASFSARPIDYALWDCHKSDSGPAISCNLLRKPAPNEIEALQSIDKDEMAVDVDAAVTKAKSDRAKEQCVQLRGDPYYNCEKAAIQMYIVALEGVETRHEELLARQCLNVLAKPWNGACL
jgi:hypothetical protein